MLERYMLENEVFIDYLLIDYFLDILYRENRLVKEMIDAMPYTNPNLHNLRIKFDNEFDKVQWDSMLSDTEIFKLTSPIKENIPNKMTRACLHFMLIY